MFVNRRIQECEAEIAQLRQRLEELSCYTINLVHELEILKEALFSKGTLSPKQWMELFQELKKQLLWGSGPWSADSKHCRRYQRDPQMWARHLFPNLSEKERQALIASYRAEKQGPAMMRSCGKEA